MYMYIQLTNHVHYAPLVFVGVAGSFVFFSSFGSEVGVVLREVGVSSRTESSALKSLSVPPSINITALSMNRMISSLLVVTRGTSRGRECSQNHSNAWERLVELERDSLRLSATLLGWYLARSLEQ